jgi:hypothetical protein
MVIKDFAYCQRHLYVGIDNAHRDQLQERQFYRIGNCVKGISYIIRIFSASNTDTDNVGPCESGLKAT